MESNVISPLKVYYWWTPDCGYLHLGEGTGVNISFNCPDGVPHWKTEEES